jgi:ubiquitin-like-conjugating enzyme ATG3
MDVDLSITYDKYYQTPRVWMMGFSENSSQPLTGAQMMQDVMGDYAMRTVTLDPHPHVAGIHASIHPCRHAAVMKTIVQNLSKAGEPSVESYLFIFLKFVSSIIPTISYDYTMEVHASTQKSVR